MRSLRAVPLERDAYASFGDVIAAKPGFQSANGGTAQKSAHVAELLDLRAGRARPSLSVFRCMPRELPFEVKLLEKHGASTQVFVPMNATRYLVIVALGHDGHEGHDEPDLGTLTAFSATGQQGITYRPGVWHHPLVALERETDFFCLVHEDGTEADCTEHPLEAAQQVRVFTL